MKKTRARRRPRAKPKWERNGKAATSRRTPKPKPKMDAWAAAEAYGIDMNLLEINLRRTPLERIRANQNAVDLIEALQRARTRRHVTA